MTVVDRFVQAVSHGGQMAKPTLIVIHSAETPLKAGYANSIATNWFGKSATTSAHFMVDPVETIRMLSDNVVSYAVGPKANGFTLNIEQAGYARLSRAEWTTPDGLVQHRKVGALVRELCDTRGIPLRWASDQQIRDAARGIPGGICFHNDIARVLGGTTHTDPIPSYPADIVMANALGGANVQPTTAPKESDVAFVSVPPGEHITIPRPRGGDCFIDVALDDNGLGYTGPVDEQRVRVAAYNSKTKIWNGFYGAKNFVFFLPTAGAAAIPLGLDDSVCVIRNLHPRWNLGVTINHTV